MSAQPNRTSNNLVRESTAHFVKFMQFNYVAISCSELAHAW